LLAQLFQLKFAKINKYVCEEWKDALQSLYFEQHENQFSSE